MPDEAAPLYLVLLFLCLLLSALFSGSEAAFLSLRRVGLQRLLSQRVPGAQRVAHLAEYPERFLPTVLLGNTLVNTAAAVLATSIALAFLSEGTAVVVATAGVTVLVLVFGEVVPKSVAVRHPERVASLVVRPFGWVERALLPVAVLLLWVSRGAAKLFGGGSTREVLVEEEIKVLVAAGREAGTVAHHEAEMLENVFRFGDRTVREVMSPRTEMVCVEEGTTLKGFLDLYKRRPHARFPVYSGSI
ncbi:MAG: DUF21 domain-containing protein, partial [Chloroflexi bacterium]|nr:DUF21 domain-containing protein [Chloroflexota bacterium]